MDALVVIDYLRHTVDQLNRKFGDFITCRRLCAENKGSRIKVAIRMLLDFIIQIHNVQDIQQLPFIFVQTFHLYVKDRTRVYVDTVVLFDIFCQTDLILVFDVHKFMLRFFIIRIKSNFFDLAQVGNPLFSHMVRYPICQQLVAVQKEPPLCNTVRLIVEFIRKHLIEIL